MPRELQGDQDLYISVDIECAGPIPGIYSMLSIGACLVSNQAITFYRELKPISENAVPEAIEVGGLSLEYLSVNGDAPPTVMQDFGSWVLRSAKGRNPVFLGFNVGFDWSFVNWYFHKFTGDNPFGIGGVDIKAFAMGRTRRDWRETTFSQLSQLAGAEMHLSHNALDDAIAQASLFTKLQAL